jgi:uncharacterized protein with PIN domain
MNDPIRFFADDMAGKLARWLRLAGWDCAYERSIPDSELVRRSEEEARMILTRDTHLSGKYPRARIFLLNSENPVTQLKQVRHAFHLDLRKGLFTRCLEDNGLVQPISRKDIQALVPPYVFETKTEFFRCSECGRVYWRAATGNRCGDAWKSG